MWYSILNSFTLKTKASFMSTLFFIFWIISIAGMVVISFLSLYFYLKNVENPLLYSPLLTFTIIFAAYILYYDDTVKQSSSLTMAMIQTSILLITVFIGIFLMKKTFSF